MSSLFYIGAFLKNIGLISFFGASIFVMYLAFSDTVKRGLYCFIPPYHLYYSLERLRHPWKLAINRVLFGGLWLTLLGLVLAKLNSYPKLVDAVVNGSITGSYYALMAFAIILIFRTTDLVNFSQADHASYAVFFILTLSGGVVEGAAGFESGIGLGSIPLFLSVILMLVFAGGLGIFSETVFIKPVQKQHPISQIILTLGLGMFYTNFAASKIFWDQEEHKLPKIIDKIGGKDSFELFSGVSVPFDGVLSVVVTIVLMVVIFSIFKYTLVGIALRSTAQSQTTSRLMGINVNRVFIVSWAVSIMLSGLAAMFYLSGQTINLYSTATLMLKGFAAAILGGFASLPGAIIGGFLLGIFDFLLSLLTNYKDALSFLIILLVLIIKPEGLFSRGSTKKV